MFCPNCGSENANDGTFCSSCGRRLKENGEKISSNTNELAYIQPNTKKEGTVFKVLGWVFFAISIVLIPILFAAGSFIMGYLLRKSSVHNETHGTILMVMAIAGGIIGMLLGMATAGL